METGELVRLMKGSPLYEFQLMKDGRSILHYAGYLAEETMGFEVLREEKHDFETAGQSEARMVRWSQVLVDGRMVWTRTVLLRRLDGVVGVGL